MIKLDFAYKGNSAVIYILVISEVCAEFVDNGYCSQLVCCKRHPKYCRYFMQEECFWGQNCKYFHKEQIVTAIVANENCYIAINYMTLNDEKYEEVLQNDLDEKNN